VICFTALTSSSAIATDLAVQGGPGGKYFRTDCSGDYVVGVYVRSGAWIDAVGLKCAPFLPNESKFKHPAWNKAYHGGGGGAPQPEGICPSDRFVSGIKFGYTREGSDPRYVDYIELTCTPITGAEPPNKVCLQTGNGCWDDPPNKAGGVMAAFQADPFKQSCHAGEAAMGLHGRSGNFVDALGLICGPKPVAAAAPKKKKSLGKRKTSTETMPPAPPAPGPATSTVKDDVDVYDVPGGVGKIRGILRKNSVVALVEPCRSDNWCHVEGTAVPTGRGWVWGDFLDF
jgi:hypothetical protein